MTRYDAIVIGGGVAGGTAAILLAQAGWSVALVEKRAFPRRKVCGECIAAPNLALLDALDVGAELAQMAGPELRRVALYVGEDALFADLPRQDGAIAGFARALGRERLDTLLLERAARLGVAILQPCAVKDVERRGSRYTCRLAVEQREAERIEAPVLIAAHGSWEPQPWHERAAKRTRGSDLVAFKANFSGASLEPGLLPVLAFRGGYGGMVVADGGMLTLACCIRRDALRGWRAAAPTLTAGDAVQAGLAARCRGVRLALEGARREGAWLSVGPVRPGIHATWSERSGFAVGNAAGEAHPILGEGISMAMQSSWLLCRRLARDRDALLGGACQAAVARAYARDWRRHFASRVRWAAVLAHLAMRPHRARPLLPLLRAAPSVLTLAARLGGKVRALDTKSGRERARPRSMVTAAVPRLGDKEA
ncbi:MAG TPA: FAD-dependent oxidoreductase [Gammaproteobacteria bacterium]|nr:FAD-dependent oxidoreductase [Gammaproteobacteria bacterium]